MSSDAGSANEQASRTMLRLKPEQRELLADKLWDLANLAAGALIFGQFLGDRPLSLGIAGLGIAAWVVIGGIGVCLKKNSR